MKKPEKESVQTAIRLPRETYDRLRKRDESITDAIKRGLDLVALEDEADEPTREFSHLIFELAREVELELGTQWHSDGIAHRTFRRMLLRAISKWRPADYNDNLFDDVKVAPFRDRPLASVPFNNADDVGTALADNVLQNRDRAARDRVRAINRETLQEIERIHGNRKGEGND
ncbi:hypothetical protein [Bradyrhizobium sp. dw_411]|uniref:hypothetical protein n=1 Tax=Bradyrhizobium sp. dw_411 TaxID=2720082 RepID=UPI001BCC2343|nr:hypothetical protein [Bradyrhizobium sp. dw_411]